MQISTQILQFSCFPRRLMESIKPPPAAKRKVKHETRDAPPADSGIKLNSE